MKKHCTVCGLPILGPLQGTVTLTNTITTRTTTEPCQIYFPGTCSCMRYVTYLSTSTAPLVAPRREPVPDAFQRAFGEEDLQL